MNAHRRPANTFQTLHFPCALRVSHSNNQSHPPVWGRNPSGQKREAHVRNWTGATVLLLSNGSCFDVLSKLIPVNVSPAGGTRQGLSLAVVMVTKPWTAFMLPEWSSGPPCRTTTVATSRRPTAATKQCLHHRWWKLSDSNGGFLFVNPNTTMSSVLIG